MTEVVFFDRPSRTLLVADLIENFEPDKIPFWMRWLVWFGGCLDPNGGTPRDMRLTFAKQKSRFRTAVETMIAWNPERIILAHGRWYDKDGARRTSPRVSLGVELDGVESTLLVIGAARQ